MLASCSSLETVSAMPASQTGGGGGAGGGEDVGGGGRGGGEGGGGIHSPVPVSNMSPVSQVVQVPLATSHAAQSERKYVRHVTSRAIMFEMQLHFAARCAKEVLQFCKQRHALPGHVTPWRDLDELESENLTWSRTCCTDHGRRTGEWCRKFVALRAPNIQCCPRTWETWECRAATQGANVRMVHVVTCSGIVVTCTPIIARRSSQRPHPITLWNWSTRHMLKPTCHQTRVAHQDCPELHHRRRKNVPPAGYLKSVSHWRHTIHVRTCCSSLCNHIHTSQS